MHFFMFIFSSDYLMISNNKNRTFGTHCGRLTGKSIIVTGDYALIKFYSEITSLKGEFLISFSGVRLSKYNTNAVS